MPDDSKAKKLAAARKKLKAYQAKEKVETNNQDVERTEPPVLDAEQSGSEVPTGKHEAAEEGRPSTCSSEPSLTKSTGSSFDSESIPFNGNHVGTPQMIEQVEPFAIPMASGAAHASTIELLINEKANLCSELGHYKADSMEKTLAVEEANVRLHDATKRIERLEKELQKYQSQNADLQASLERTNAMLTQSTNEVQTLKDENVEFKEHIEELKQTVQRQTDKTNQLEDQLKEKECELELNKIRINQISDVASVENDSKVEVLMQQKFMHEQQIRDLQSMVQQLEVEREQSNRQYQSYVQHLNKEIGTLRESESNKALENRELIGREQSLIEHVGQLERQLQKIIATQQKQRANQEDLPKNLAEDELNVKLKAVTDEKNALSEKCQAHETQIDELQRMIETKIATIQQLEGRMENLSSLQTDSTKLLSRVESETVAASRAVAQNEQLKQQLDEVQTKLIQVMNDKVELTNELDSERFANREMRTNYDAIDKQLAELREKLHFKDEEMIRLTKENNELTERLAGIGNPEVSMVNGANGDEHHSHEVCHTESENHNHHDHDSHCSEGEHDHDHHGHDHQEHDHHDHDHHGHSHSHSHSNDHKPSNSIPAKGQTVKVIPPTEAMQKLETRFNFLMSEVANLTDEKQRLEHLVLQLQGETDTIGEYIALYQAQRRVLKQREIERNAQLHKLKTDREELHNKIAMLNQLVNNLSQQPNFTSGSALSQTISNPSDAEINSIQSDSSRIMNPENPADALSNSKQLNSSEIIHAIKNIVVDLKNNEQLDVDFNFVPALDHCSCCSGKFETI